MLNDIFNKQPSAKKLYLVDSKGKILTTVDKPYDFLYLFLIDWNYRYNTVDSNGEYVCGTSCRRSLLEIFQILKTQFPNYSLEEYWYDIWLILKFVNEKKKNYLVIHYCSDIKRWVVFCGKGHNSIYGDFPYNYVVISPFHSNEINEFGIVLKSKLKKYDNQ